MDKTTPIQKAIAYWTERASEAPTLQMRAAAELFIQYLKESIEKEKEFAEYVWMQGVATGYQSGKHGFSNKPTLPEFLNQLYPGK